MNHHALTWIGLCVALTTVWAAEEGDSIPRRTSSVITATDRDWWSFKPIQRVNPPSPRAGGMIHNTVDQFIAARLETEQIQPTPEASREILVRRVTLDLTGLPPTPQEVEAFVHDSGEQAYERLVDRLLASVSYGERMARHWLDLVRYSDGDGYRADDYRPDAWRYRDYVIRSLNADKPYNRFIAEQLAGDELFPDEPEAIIATGYLRNGIYEWNARDVRGQWDVILNDLTDTTADVFLGMGIQCARCHDHKFDPILQRDYYRLRAFFAPIQPGDRPAANASTVAEHDRKLKEWEKAHAELKAELDRLEQPYLYKAETNAVARFPLDIQAMIRKPQGERTPLESQLASLAWRQVVYDWDRVDRTFKGEEKERLLSLRREMALLSKTRPQNLPMAMAATDVGPIAPPTWVPKKENLGAIEPGFPTVLDPTPAVITPLPHSTGRRSALVRWLTHPEHPLTARVLVNRVWQQHFGRGLAANASDFGVLGEKPSHPELLDWLAHWFTHEAGGSLKQLHRLLVTSAAYRRDSHVEPFSVGKRKDPENRWLWRWQPRRMEAESIRDCMLAVTGELENVQGGPGLTPDVPRRTIYTRFMRNNRDPLAEAFDAPLCIASTASRDTTTTPMQSLLLANSAALRTRGRALASRLERSEARYPEAQIRLAYQWVYNRDAQPSEVDRALTFLNKQASMADPKRLASDQANFIPGKVPYRDGQAAWLDPEGPQKLFEVSGSDNVTVSNALTVEAFFMLRTVSDSEDMRTLVARGTGQGGDSGWQLGITGNRSNRRPLALALQLSGVAADGSHYSETIHSDLGIQLNKPYFAGAAVTPSGTNTVGKVIFALKDLSNDDEPVLIAHAEHRWTLENQNHHRITLGGCSGIRPQSFHGMLDDVRLSGVSLDPDKMLWTTESGSAGVLGYWKFELRPDVMDDSSGHRLKLARPQQAQAPSLTAHESALADFCQALLNSSEFLYLP